MGKTPSTSTLEAVAYIRDNPDQFRYKIFKQAHPASDVSNNQWARLRYEVLQRPDKDRRYADGAPVVVEVPAPITDKKMGEFSWREWAGWIKDGQALKKKASYSQDTALIDFGHLTEPICVITLSDLHWGSWATDYEALESITNEILSTPNLYIALLGDLEQMAIVLRNVLEISDNVLPPELQHRFSEAWLDEMAPRILFATWENHSIMREEKATGYSRLADLLKRRVIYHNNIGHPDIKVGNQIYKLAVSHVFRGSSIDNPCHGPMRYMRREGIDREICLQGDRHVPGISHYTDGYKERLAITSGTTQTESGYGKRHFSLFTHDVFPCFTLAPDVHEFTPYWSLRAWKRATDGSQSSAPTSPDCT